VENLVSREKLVSSGKFGAREKLVSSGEVGEQWRSW
jgi:hypothetical protein